ncbi:MAG: hypothetical protein V3573_10890 [Desulfovibrionaceae bacterium]
MPVVEGQLELWQFFSNMSGVSHSIASNGFREYIEHVAKSQKRIADILPRWITPIPVVDENGVISGDVVEPFIDTGRIVQGQA